MIEFYQPNFILAKEEPPQTPIEDCCDDDDDDWDCWGGDYGNID